MKNMSHGQISTESLRSGKKDKIRKRYHKKTSKQRIYIQFYRKKVTKLAWTRT